MNFLHDPDFKIGFPTGVVLHLILIWTRVKIFPLPMKCIGSCRDTLLGWDIPVMLLYYAFDDSRAIMMSMIIGSAYWGFIFFYVLKLFRYFIEKRR